LININRFFPWLSIRTKLIVAFTGLSIIPIIVVGFFAVWSTADNLIDTAKRDLNNHVQVVRQRAGDFLESVKIDLRFLLGSDPFYHLDLRLVNNGAHEIGDMKSLAAELVNFIQTKKSYYRIRILDRYGAEMMRVESASGKLNSDKLIVAPQKGLSHIRKYYYVFLTDSLKDGQIAFSPAEILGENGGLVAIVSFATPLYDGGRRAGILVADVYASKFFQTMESDSVHKYDRRILLVSGDGHFLYDSQRKREWTKLFVPTKDDIKDEYTEPISEELLSEKAGIVTKGIKQLVSHSPLFQGVTGKEEQGVESGFSIPLFIIESIPKEILMRPVYSTTFAFGAAIIGFLILSITLSLLATSQFTKPIAEMRKGAEIISSGNYGHRLRIETRDEIEKLSEQFNMMAESLMIRDQELQDHRASLERKVAERTKELFDEKNKLQTILDNVPSALLVLDRTMRIQTVSAAFAKVTGYQPKEVIGKDCCDFFCKAGFCRTCVSKNVIQTGKVGSHLDQVINPDGTDRYIEHFSVPMEKDGKVESILEIVSDVTNRKRLEQHLIKTEKLATMGELAAFIAHEFRNSLTSIKMILQLFNESQDLDRSKKESLMVALSSAYRMESTVSELLGFAKPTKMDFKIASVNQVVENSIAFVKLHADKARVIIERNLAPSLPDLPLDVVHLREALVNIILNAVQAIENRDFSSSSKIPSGKYESRILICTRKFKIGKTLRDFMDNELVKPAADQQTDLREILLRKGADCVQIEISDTGPGIESVNLARIFDPFFTTKPNGTGLGLSMVKRVVNGHDGVIVVGSKLGSGTKFKIFLPLTRPLPTSTA